MNAIYRLERLGFTFTLEGDQIHGVHQGERPDPKLVRALLAEVHEHKDEALRFLRAETARPNCPCWICGCDDWWLSPGREWLCNRCHPNPIQLRDEWKQQRNLQHKDEL